MDQVKGTRNKKILLFPQGQDWNLESALFFSYLRSGNRKRKQQKYQRHYFFAYDLPKLSAGSIAILQNIPAIYDYTTVFTV